MNKLNEMDTKLDNINEKLDRNYEQLSTEEIRTQAKVDQVLLEEQENAISLFNTNYVEKIADYQRDFSDYLEQSYKAYVNDVQISDIYVEKVESGWSLVTTGENPSASAREIKVELSNFVNAKEFLNENYNVVANGFMDKFAEDLEANINENSLPEGMKEETLRDFINANIIENFTKKYYEENHAKALEIRNLAINYAKQINGKAVKSIADRYVARMKYMFNFAGEMKKYAIGSIANLAHTLDVNTTLAAQACLYAGVNQDEIREEHVEAREVLKNYFEGVEEMPDNYCFLTNNQLGGNFYRAHFETKFTNKGNDCKFNAEFTLENVDAYRKNYFEKDDIKQHNFVDQLDHTRIVTRMNLMRTNGLVQSEDYITYLKDVNVIPFNAYRTYTRLLNDNWLSNDALRFLTGLTTRAMNDSDKNIEMTCNEKGNEKGSYYDVGWRGHYKANNNASSWNGNIAETTYIDATTGQVMQNKTVCAYATYSESHWYWSNDEHYSFLDNVVGNYFFSLEYVG